MVSAKTHVWPSGRALMPTALPADRLDGSRVSMVSVPLTEFEVTGILVGAIQPPRQMSGNRGSDSAVRVAAKSHMWRAQP